MTYAKHGPSSVDYAPCRYGASKVPFRGPKRRAEGRYAVFLGGSETYGRFLKQPFPLLAERQSGLPAVNLGYVNAGLDLVLSDPTLVEIVAKAEVAVIQLGGAQNLSNRMYSVHPRRNDRFLSASRLLRTIYAEVDFTEVHFTRHLLCRLNEAAPEKFAMVRAELQEAWLARMRALLDRLEGRAVLLWLSRRRPEDPANGIAPVDEPLFLTRAQLEDLRDRVRGIVEVVGQPEEIRTGREGLCLASDPRAVTEDLLGAEVHRRAAEALLPYLHAAR
jgi:hypothetical protein